MAGYPLQQLQQEVINAAKECSCEASLRQALQRLQAPAMLGWWYYQIESQGAWFCWCLFRLQRNYLPYLSTFFCFFKLSKRTSLPESHSGIFSGLGESLEELGHKAKEALYRWHFLDGWSGDRSASEYLPEDVTEVLRSLREGSGVFGMDIGGTLAKAAQLLAPGESHISPSTFGKTGTFHKELSFQLKARNLAARIDAIWINLINRQVKDVMHDVHFLSGATYYLETWWTVAVFKRVSKGILILMNNFQQQICLEVL